MASADDIKGFGFHYVVECDLCNSTGKIRVFNELLNEEDEVDCPACDGKGQLKRRKL